MSSRGSHSAEILTTAANSIVQGLLLNKGKGNKDGKNMWAAVMERKEQEEKMKAMQARIARLKKKEELLNKDINLQRKKADNLGFTQGSHQQHMERVREFQREKQRLIKEQQEKNFVARRAREMKLKNSRDQLFERNKQGAFNGRQNRSMNESEIKFYRDTHNMSTQNRHDRILRGKIDAGRNRAESETSRMEEVTEKFRARKATEKQTKDSIAQMMADLEAQENELLEKVQVTAIVHQSEASRLPNVVQARHKFKHLTC